MKVFLNLCSHGALGAPHLKKKLDGEGKEVEGWNIPLAVGPPRPTTDHKGDAALVYDCVVNPKVWPPRAQLRFGGGCRRCFAVGAP